MGISAVLLLSSVLGSVQPAPPARGFDKPKGDISVTGTGRVFIKPDVAITSLGVEIMAPTLEGATKETSDRMAKVLAAVKAAGIDDKDITTTSYKVNPITSEPKEGKSPQITGYRVSNIMQVKIRKIEDAGRVIDAAMGTGANHVGSIFFAVNDPKPHQKQARHAAVKEAMEKASQLAAAAGVKIGKIISITEGGGPVPVFAERAFLLAAAQAPGPIVTGENEISVTVEMHVEILH